MIEEGDLKDSTWTWHSIDYNKMPELKDRRIGGIAIYSTGGGIGPNKRYIGMNEKEKDILYRQLEDIGSVGVLCQDDWSSRSQYVFVGKPGMSMSLSMSTSMSKFLCLYCWHLV